MALSASQYVGNPDYRGYLSALAQSGDANAAAALSMVGNDGGIDQNKMQNWASGPAVAPGQDQVRQQQLTDYINSAFNTYNTLANAKQGSALNSTSSGNNQADTQAYWADQQAALQQKIDQLDPQQQTGLGNIQGSYDSAYKTLQNGGNAAEQQFQQNQLQDTTNNLKAKDQINQNAQQNGTAIQRLLGSRGAGSSSAAQIAAPLAVATQANNQRTTQNDQYGQNENNLQAAIAKERTDLANSMGDLSVQKTSKENTLNQGIAQSKLSLIQNLANAKVQAAQAAGQNYTSARNAQTPYQAQIQQLLGQIDALGATPTFTPQAVNYTPPSLASYNVTRNAAPTVGSNTPGGIDTSGAGAFFTLLNGGQQKQQGNGTTPLLQVAQQ